MSRPRRQPFPRMPTFRALADAGLRGTEAGGGPRWGLGGSQPHLQNGHARDMGLEGHVGMTGGLAPQSLGDTLPRPLSPQDLPTHP